MLNEKENVISIKDSYVFQPSVGERVGKFVIFAIVTSFILILFLPIGISVTSTSLIPFILMVLFFTAVLIFPITVIALSALRKQIKLDSSNKTLSFRRLLGTTTFRNTDITTWGIRTVYNKNSDTGVTYNTSFNASFYFECTVQNKRKFIYPIPYWKRDKGEKVNAQYISEDKENFLQKFQQVIGKEPEKIEDIGLPNKASGTFFDNNLTTIKYLFRGFVF